MKQQNGHATPLTTRELSAMTGVAVDAVELALGPEGIVPLTSATIGATADGVRGFLEKRGVVYRPRIIAHITMRGGTGKTTATISAAVRAAQYGFKVCILDLDPQGSSTLAFGAAPEEGDPIFYDVWQNPRELIPDALKTVRENLTLLPSSLENALLDASLINPGSQKKAVREVCEALRACGCDAIIIDCPPSLGIAVISTVCAVDTAVIPVGSDAFSIRGLEITLSEIASIRDTFGLPMPEIRILYSRHDRREKISGDMLDSLRRRYAHIPLTVIGTSSEFSKALAAGKTVFSSFRKSQARDDYDRYVRDVFGIGFFKNGT
jgi:chromosome partitioning protein